jgi:hypothetical protein
LVADAGDSLDVFKVDLDDAASLSQAAAPGAQHVALWLSGEDLFARRDRALRALDLRLTVDPYAVLDVVLYPSSPFPLDLLEMLRARLAGATPSYASRALAHRGEDLQRRISVVLPGTFCSRADPRAATARFPQDWVDAVRDLVPVYREMSAREAAEQAGALGERLEGARILDREIDRSSWAMLVSNADPAAVSFAQREHEAAWTRGVVEYGVSR